MYFVIILFATVSYLVVHTINELDASSKQRNQKLTTNNLQHPTVKGFTSYCNVQPFTFVSETCM